MAKKKATSTPAEAAAGEQNLNNWLAEHPSGGNLRHGAHSSVIKRRYTDLRFRTGRELRGIMDALIEDLGGNDRVTAGQRLLLDNIKSKVITLLCIGKFIDSQESPINEKGELLSCLSSNYLAFSNSLRLDLIALYGMTPKKGVKIPTIEEIIAKGDKE